MKRRGPTLRDMQNRDQTNYAIPVPCPILLAPQPARLLPSHPLLSLHPHWPFFSLPTGCEPCALSLDNRACVHHQFRRCRRLRLRDHSPRSICYLCTSAPRRKTHTPAIRTSPPLRKETSTADRHPIRVLLHWNWNHGTTLKPSHHLGPTRTGSVNRKKSIAFSKIRPQGNYQKRHLLNTT